MLIPVTLDELQTGDEIVVTYHAKPGRPESAVECRGPFTNRGMSLFGSTETEIEYIKVGQTPILVLNIIRIERVVREGDAAKPAPSGQQSYRCTFNGLTDQQIAVLGEFSEEVKREPPATSFFVSGFQQIELLRDAATRLGLGEPAVSKWSRGE